MEFVPAVFMVALVWKLVDLVKYVRNGDVNAALTQLTTYAAGVGVAFLFAATQWADGIMIGDAALSSLSGASLVVAGLALASTGSALYDFKKARDNSDSAATPKLFK